MGEQATRDREFGPLERIRDNHPKYVTSAKNFLTKGLKFVAKSQTKFPRARKI